MSELTQQLNLIFSLATIAGEVIVVLLLILLFTKPNRFHIFFRRWGILFGFIVSLGATAFSLIYSNVIGFEPCTLCWYQRIFLFPQVLLFGIALFRKEKNAIVEYSLGLSIVGGLIAAYHYYGQMFNESALPCAADTGISACAVRFFVEFGYITIPMMSLTTFMILIVFMCHLKKYGTV